MKQNRFIPAILFSALRGSNGKTVVSLGVTYTLRKRGISVTPFKKGPDYIDAAWLTKAAGENCYHLDLYLMGEKGIKEAYLKRTKTDSISIVEGNRGLFDGVDIYGTYSTAKIATLLGIPVILIIDCTKITNTAAALIMGCQAYDPDVTYGGVILNKIANNRHAEIISQSIEYHTKLPVLGQIPKLDIKMPERHLGLTTVTETEDFEKRLNVLGNVAEEYIQIDRLLEIANNVKGFSITEKQHVKQSLGLKIKKVRIGIIRDAAFQFYYPENLEALRDEGAEIIEFNSMTDKEVNNIDLLYIAGGFPEVHADQLTKNKSFRDSIKRLADSGLPIYGECGGVIYLGDSVFYNEKKYAMCGVFPIDFELKKKPVGHGYTDIKVDSDNPFFPKGAEFKGHEFHYSFPVNWKTNSFQTAFNMEKGFGINGNRDGVFYKNVFATYTHLHASGTDLWAKNLVKVANCQKVIKKKLIEIGL